MCITDILVRFPPSSRGTRRKHFDINANTTCRRSSKAYIASQVWLCRPYTRSCCRAAIFTQRNIRTIRDIVNFFPIVSILCLFRSLYIFLFYSSTKGKVIFVNANVIIPLACLSCPSISVGKDLFSGSRWSLQRRRYKMYSTLPSIIGAIFNNIIR